MTQAINKLAALTAGNDLTGDFEHDENIRRAESQPAPQLPMDTGERKSDLDILAQSTPDQNYRRLVQSNGDDTPVLGDDITAALLMGGMTATWAMNHWVVKFKDGHTATKRVGGRVIQRSQTAVGAKAELSEWMHEINQLAGLNVFGDSTER